MQAFRNFLLSLCILLCTCTTGRAVTIDRIAVVVYNHVIKDSDIDRDIRLVSFLNDEHADFSMENRRASASRLIDQQIIRREIDAGEYPQPSSAEIQKTIDELKKNRYHSASASSHALHQYSLTSQQLVQYVRWQLAVLKFIDLRFRPSVQVTEDDIQSYYKAHLDQLRQENPGTPHSLNALHDQIEQAIAGERINQEFYDWLARRRKSAKPQFHEESLQ